LVHPEAGERKNQVLKIEPDSMFKFYFNFQFVSRNSRVCKRRSV
jgi:hypothetical protein